MIVTLIVLPIDPCQKQLDPAGSVAPTYTKKKCHNEIEISDIVSDVNCTRKSTASFLGMSVKLKVCVCVCVCVYIPSIYTGCFTT
jgi:hypothetical protein